MGIFEVNLDTGDKKILISKEVKIGENVREFSRVGLFNKLKFFRTLARLPFSTL